MFPIRSELQSAVATYGAMIDAHAHLWERPREFWLENPKDRAMEFACASALLSDADTAEIPHKTWYTDDEKNQQPWLWEFFENDASLAATFLTPRGPCGRTIHPICINMPLVRSKRSAKWRVSSDRGVESSIPAGVHGRHMVLEWRRAVFYGTRYLRGASEREKSVFAWAMHDALLFLRPFRDGNGRTARLLIQDVRQELGLLPVAFETAHRLIHRERTKFFNKELLIPHLHTKYAVKI